MDNIEEFNCKCGCNYPCSCNLNTALVYINNNCYNNCHYCTQIHSRKLTSLDIKKLQHTFSRKDISKIDMMGGEFSLLPQKDIEYIYILAELNPHIDITICTSDFSLYNEESLIFFDYHIIDFSFIPKIRKHTRFNIVLNDNEMETIYNYLTKYKDILFYCAYDNQTKKPFSYNSFSILEEIFELPNVRMRGFFLIKKLIKLQNKSIAHKLIQNLLRYICLYQKNEEIICYTYK